GRRRYLLRSATPRLPGLGAASQRGPYLLRGFRPVALPDRGLAEEANRGGEGVPGRRPARVPGGRSGDGEGGGHGEDAKRERPLVCLVPICVGVSDEARRVPPSSCRDGQFLTEGAVGYDGPNEQVMSHLAGPAFSPQPAVLPSSHHRG